MQLYQPQASSVEGIFPDYQLNQEAMNELKMLLKIQFKKEYLLCKTGDTKNRVHDFQKCKTIRSFILAISNETTTLYNAGNDGVNLKPLRLMIWKNIQHQNFKKK